MSRLLSIGVWPGGGAKGKLLLPPSKNGIYIFQAKISSRFGQKVFSWSGTIGPFTNISTRASLYIRCIMYKMFVLYKMCHYVFGSLEITSIIFKYLCHEYL